MREALPPLRLYPMKAPYVTIVSVTNVTRTHREDGLSCCYILVH
jgi:hypothetical protein